MDYLNSLSEEYWWFPRPNPDSIYLYASQAYEESVKNNDSAGLTKSTLNLGVSEMYYRNFPAAELYFRQSILLSGMMREIKTAGWANLYLGWVLFLKNDYPGAEEAYNKATYYFDKSGGEEGKGRNCAYKSMLYAAMGEYGKGFEYCRSSLQTRRKMNDHVCILYSYNNFGNLYKAAGDYETALDYYRQSLSYAKEHKIVWDENDMLGSVYSKLNNFDSSFYYLRQSSFDHPKDPIIKLSLSETYLGHKDYDSSLKISLELIQSFRKSDDRFHLMTALLNAGLAYLEKNNDAMALKYTSEAMLSAQKAGAKQSMIEGYQLIAKIYSRLGKADSAYQYVGKYAILKDSLLTRKFLSRLNDFAGTVENERKQAQVALMDKDIKIKDQQLKQESLFNIILLVSILSIALLCLIISRNNLLRRKNEKLLNNRKQGELQQQSLRAQMNPHFLFNSLNSINRFILQNNKSQASEYLAKFSKLVRFILQNSEADLIPLDYEIESLKLYLELEALRFEYHFEYGIRIDEDIETDAVKVPPLIIQPYVENAIWHGLMHKEEIGQLDVEISQKNNYLFINITDDGIGRKKATELSSKSATRHKSMGLKLTEERIATMPCSVEYKPSVKINDLVNPDGTAAGTEVIIQIPLKYDKILSYR
ncbi:MAG TPA: histidine kinase [Puia sp.]|nr:histidine kinase [Puia sp.]